MTTEPGPHFASTRIDHNTRMAVRITKGGTPADKAQPFKVCAGCWSDTTGGGLSQEGACSNGCGRLAAAEGEAA
jgi:hypothetical protein